MRLGKFSLCLNVKDLQTSRFFYETLGFEVRAGNEADHWLLMTNGEAYIGLMQGMFEKNMLTFITNQDHHGQHCSVRPSNRQHSREVVALEKLVGPPSAHIGCSLLIVSIVDAGFSSSPSEQNEASGCRVPLWRGWFK